ncbi:MAG: flagellar hook-length control protein FliK, partial [Desulfotomaculales bacterium]
SDPVWQFWSAKAAGEPGGLPTEGREVILAAGGLPEQSRSFDEGMARTGTGFLGSFYQTGDGTSIPVELSQLAAAISQMVLQPQQRQAVLRVKLIPEHLGELTVHLAMVGKKLTVTFSVAEQATKEVLVGNLAQLQHHLLHLDHRLEDVILQVDKGIADGLPSSLAEGRNPKEEGGGGWEHPDRSGTLFGEGSGRSGIVESRQDRFGLGVPAWLNILV